LGMPENHVASYMKRAKERLRDLLDYPRAAWGWKLQIADWKLQIADYKLQIADYKLKIADWRLKIADYLNS
jgi:hypothetical protein